MIDIIFLFYLLNTSSLFYVITMLLLVNNLPAIKQAALIIKVQLFSSQLRAQKYREVIIKGF